MANLQNMEFRTTIDSSSSDIIMDFYIPALMSSISFERGVGYFSSGWFRIASKGMVNFARNSGRARWVTSPIIREEDWHALYLGAQARENPDLLELLSQRISDLEKGLERNTLSALAWMIADGIIEIKLAIPINKLEGGNFHAKFGIFTDAEGNQVTFNGSYNDSIQGTRNYESIKIFCSWNAAFKEDIAEDVKRFNMLWNNEDPNVQVYNLPEAAKEKILRFRTESRPYPEPDWIKDAGSQPTSIKIQVPSHIKLRDYQEEAIDAWFKNDNKGIFEMATGTGKTITALAAAARLTLYQARYVLVIAVPYKHLVDQWTDESLDFGFRPVKVYESSKKWAPELKRVFHGYEQKWLDQVTIVTTMDSLKRDVFRDLIKEFWPETLLIIDEAHHAGAPVMLKALPEETPWRLGLSATPVRHYDDDGTERILSFFDDVVYELGLEQAIGRFLTPYYYYPYPVEMTEDEFATYCEITEKLQSLYHTDDPDDPISEYAKRLAIQRARIMNNSESKLTWLDQHIKPFSKLDYTLFYVGDMLFDPTLEMLAMEKRLRIAEFTQRQNSKQRKQLLEDFSEKKLQALVAMKCLDEGVDVPPTRTAYFLASSGNPREFVQRRGRILRKAEGKTHAEVIDLISVPPWDFIELGDHSPHFSAVRAAFRREYKRMKEFANLAENQYKSLERFFRIADKLNLIDE